jgi:carbamoyltransferase
MTILGLNAFHGDASAAVFRDGQLVAALEEERLNRVKHWAGVPMAAAKACLAGSHPDHIAIARDPRAHLSTKVLRTLTRPGTWRRALARGRNLTQVASIDDIAAQLGTPGKIAKTHFVEHHRAHLASAFLCSPFEESAVVSIDGFGDYSSVMWGVGRGNRIEVMGSVRFPHSLGIFYTAITQYLGFPKYGDEYKMMGLSAYGEPEFAKQIRDMVRTEDDQVILNLDYFTHDSKGVEMNWSDGEPNIGAIYSDKLIELLGPPRERNSELTARHNNIAASAQVILEENYFALLNYVQKRTGQKNVCLAGGVALNVVANGQVFERSKFTGLWVQPGASDGGTSIGAALHVMHEVLGQPRSYEMRHVYLGPEWDQGSIARDIESANLPLTPLPEDELVAETAAHIADGKVIGWFQGRMEFGPRALGNRSILADPRSLDMKDTLNRRIKFREPFRPFCPSILAEEVGKWFETDYPSPYMVCAYKIKPEQRSRIPAVTHGDGTGRLQTVERDVNPLYWKLIKAFERISGVPVLLNTSFNENEPIVYTPKEAIDCFLRTRMDVLVVGPYILEKTAELNRVSEQRTAVGAS